MPFFAAGGGGRSAAAFPELTERELEILELIAAGCSNAEIGQRLGIAPRRSGTTSRTCFNKLQVADRSQAIVRAREAGLGGGDPCG